MYYGQNYKLKVNTLFDFNLIFFNYNKLNDTKFMRHYCIFWNDFIRNIIIIQPDISYRYLNNWLTLITKFFRNFIFLYDYDGLIIKTIIIMIK